MNEQFYLVLPSNSSLNIFLENKTSSYKIQLPYSLEFNITKWEVALSKIQFPNNFYTIRDGRNRTINQYLSPSRNDLNYLYNNVEGKGNKEELEKTRNALGNKIMYIKNPQRFYLVFMIIFNRFYLNFGKQSLKISGTLTILTTL